MVGCFYVLGCIYFDGGGVCKCVRVLVFIGVFGLGVEFVSNVSDILEILSKGEL